MQTHKRHQSTHDIICERFGSPEAAEKYAAAQVGTAMHRREVRCIKRVLGDLPAGAAVLDLPCGTGRLLPALLRRGYRVTEADSSPHMVEKAKETLARIGGREEQVRYIVADALGTGLPDRSFDAVICNRLLHHFPDSQTRRRVLAELARVARGRIVVSFFCSTAWDSAVFFARNALRRVHPDDRVPISYSTMSADARAVGLRVARVAAVRPGISKQWYLGLERAEPMTMTMTMFKAG